jgi:hypothetical protein
MRTKLMIDGNAVYEVEEECLRRKKQAEQKTAPAGGNRFREGNQPHRR